MASGWPHSFKLVFTSFKSTIDRYSSRHPLIFRSSSSLENLHGAAADAAPAPLAAGGVGDEAFSVSRAILADLSSEDFFGYAASKEGDQYLGFCFGKDCMVVLDEASVLVEKGTAVEYRERIKPDPTVNTVPPPVLLPVGGVTTGPAINPGTPEIATVKNHFYATVDIDAVTAKLKFAEIVDEIVEQFTAKLGVEVSISVEIQAKSSAGFDEGLQRSVKENCNVLRFNSSEFDRE